MISHRSLRETSRGRRPPTLGTLITSSLPRKRAAATPNFFLTRSASSNGVRRPTAMSLETWAPPSPSTEVCLIEPSE